MPSRNLLLRSLGPAIAQVKGSLTPTLWRAGQVICEPGDKVERICFPTSGLISARALLESGHQMECVLVGHTSAIGVVSAVGFHSSLTRDVCLVDTHGWTMPLSALEAAMRTIPMLEEELKRFSFQMMAYAVRVGVCNSMHTAEQRVSRWLLIAGDLLRGPEIRLAQEELSNVLGLQRSAVNPVLQKLKAQGIVDLSRGRIAIINPGALERRACECLDPLRRSLSVGAAPAAAA